MNSWGTSLYRSLCRTVSSIYNGVFCENSSLRKNGSGIKGLTFHFLLYFFSLLFYSSRELSFLHRKMNKVFYCLLLLIFHIFRHISLSILKYHCQWCNWLPMHEFVFFFSDVAFLSEKLFFTASGSSKPMLIENGSSLFACLRSIIILLGISVFISWS